MSSFEREVTDRLFENRRQRQLDAINESKTGKVGGDGTITPEEPAAGAGKFGGKKKKSGKVGGDGSAALKEHEDLCSDCGESSEDCECGLDESVEHEENESLDEAGVPAKKKKVGSQSAPGGSPDKKKKAGSGGGGPNQTECPKCGNVQDSADFEDGKCPECGEKINESATPDEPLARTTESIIADIQALTEELKSVNSK